MAKRYKMSKYHSRRSFAKGANRIHRKNISTVSPYISRGGVRL